MNKRIAKTPLIAALVAPLALSLGCAARQDSIEEKLAAMSAEIQRVKAENSHLSARNQQLDDKVLLYEKKAESDDQQRHATRKLDVVRLERDPQSEREAQRAEYREISLREHGATAEPAPAEPSDDGPRPVLRLAGGWSGGSVEATSPASPASPSAPRFASAVNGPVPPTGRGDNLGVVTAQGLTGASAATPAPAATEPLVSDEMAQFNMAYRAYSNGNYDTALAGFATFLKHNPQHDYADRAMYWLGECYLGQGKMLKAIGEFERLVRRFPKSEQAAAALYRLGFVYDRMQDQVRAREYYFAVVELHPGTEAARKASRRMAALASDNTQATTIAASAER